MRGNMRMRCGVILAIIGFLFISSSKGWGADWESFGGNATADFYYDTENITHPSKDVIRVYVKRLYTEKGVSDLVGVLGVKFKTVRHSVDSYEVQCGDKKFRLLSSVVYSTDEEILESFNYQEPTWKVIVPESVIDTLYKTLCK